jgi:REP element-mobilizing transposase RayT
VYAADTPLTPAFRPVTLAGDRHKPFQRLTLDTDVRAFLLPLLDPPYLGTLNREKLLNKEGAARLSRYLTEYAAAKGLYTKINYVNADHVHVLVDLPTGLSIEEVIQLLKGSSSHWVNANNILSVKLAWGRGYGAFSVSESKYRRGCSLHCRARGTSSGTHLRG